MDTVRPTGNAKYYSGQGHATGESDGVKSKGDTAALALDQASIADSIDLSMGTQDALAEIQGDLDHLKESYPALAHHVPQVNRLQSFLRNPHSEQLAELNPSFRELYEKVERLGAHLQQVMSRMRDEAKAGDGATYRI